MEAYSYLARRTVTCDVCGERYETEGEVCAGSYFTNDACPECADRAWRRREARKRKRQVATA